MLSQSRAQLVTLAFLLAGTPALGTASLGAESAPAHSHDHRTQGPQAEVSAVCTCETARFEDGWCPSCRVGYAATVQIPSAALYEFIDTHGHEITIEKSSCPSCPAALAANSFCQISKTGFVDGRAYVSRLAYLIAKGQRIDLKHLDCRTCRSHYMDSGWCGPCRRGIVGTKSYSNRHTFGQAAQEFRRLIAAVERVASCEFCGIAQFSDGRCSQCNIFYSDGRPVPVPSPDPEIAEKRPGKRP